MSFAIREFLRSCYTSRYGTFIHICEYHSLEFFDKSRHKSMRQRYNQPHRFPSHNSKLPSFSFCMAGKGQRGSFSRTYVFGNSIFFHIFYRIERRAFPRYTLPFFGFFRIDTLLTCPSTHKSDICLCGRYQDKDACSKALFFYCRFSHRNAGVGLCLIKD